VVSPEDVERFDAADPFLVHKRTLPDGRCVRLYAQLYNFRMTVAPDPGADSFDLVYDYDADLPELAAAVARTWDGTGEPVGYVRRMPPLYDAGEDAETWPGGDQEQEQERASE
jgi:hypothetical protein